MYEIHKGQENRLLCVYFERLLYHLWVLRIFKFYELAVYFYKLCATIANRPLQKDVSCPNRPVSPPKHSEAYINYKYLADSSGLLPDNA